MVYRFELPSQEDVEKIYADINASKQSIDVGVQYLMQWMEQQPHLPDIKDKEFLSNFLVGCKNSLEMAKKRINSYYINKARMPEIYTNRDPCSAEFKKCMKAIYLIPLPKLTPDNYRIVIHGFDVRDQEDIPTAQNVLKFFTSLMDVNFKADLVKGYISICDLANLNISLNKLFMSLYSTSLQIMKNGAPVRLHKIYVLNLTPTFQFLINFCLSFMSEKLSSRVIIWKKDPKHLNKIFPKEILPSDYGGEEVSIDELKGNTLERLIHYRDWLMATDNEKADLSGEQSYSSVEDVGSMYGMEGSFRKISFD